MYIQPYEPLDLSFGTQNLTGSSAAGAPAFTETDGIAQPDDIPSFGDAEAALDDGPLGQLGLGAMLQNLTGMMQQLVQMMQSLLGRLPGSENGTCTQPTENRRYPT